MSDRHAIRNGIIVTVGGGVILAVLQAVWKPARVGLVWLFNALAAPVSVPIILLVAVVITLAVAFATRRWSKPPADPSPGVALLLRNASLAIPRTDEGELRAYIWLVNFSSQRVILDRVLMGHWTWLSRSMPELPWTVRGLGSAIEPTAVGTLYIATQLNTAAIRLIRESSPPELWRLLGGGLALTISGELEVRPGPKAIRFQLEDQRPAITAYWFGESKPSPLALPVTPAFSVQQRTVLSMLKALDGAEAALPLLVERGGLSRLELDKAIDGLEGAGLVKRLPATYEALPAIVLTAMGRDRVLAEDPGTPEG